MSHKPFQPQSCRRLWSLALLGLLFLGGVSQQAASALPQREQAVTAQANRPQRPATRLPQRVLQQIKRDLSDRFNIPPQELRNLTVVDFSQETWNDSCLGLAGPNERCAMLIVEGWRVEVTNGQQNWIYRTDRTAEIIRPETKQNAELPPDVMERLFETVGEQENVPLSSLRVTEIQPATWDGCMGIYEPERMCIQIAISGWRVIVAGDTESWVYHVSEDGSRIVQNVTASGSQAGLVPSFIPTEGQEPAPVEENVVFRVTVSGGLGGVQSETVLMADGSVYRRVWQPLTPTTSDPVIEQRISPEEARQFQQLLQDQRFPNLNGLRYITDAAFADYPTTTLQAMGSTVQYIDLEQDNLPPALQTILQAWEELEL